MYLGRVAALLEVRELAKADPLKAAVRTLKKRVADGALEVASPQWVRAYWRGHPQKLVDFIMAQFPKEVVGSGEQGEHLVTVVHALRPSLLDGPAPPTVVEGERIPVDGVKVSNG